MDIRTLLRLRQTLDEVRESVARQGRILASLDTLLMAEINRIEAPLPNAALPEEISDFWAQKFWEKVNRSDGPGACWYWTGAVSGRGTGRLIRGGKQLLAHRVAWTLSGRELTEGMNLRNTCGNLICVNPDHYERGLEALREAGESRPPLESVHHDHPLTEPVEPVNLTQEQEDEQKYGPVLGLCRWGHSKRRRGSSIVCLTCERRRSRDAYTRRQTEVTS